MDKTLNLLHKGFESSSGKTPEFTSFTRIFKTEFRNVLNAMRCKNITFNVGHFYISGFFDDANGQLWYFNIGDVRWMSDMIILVRTAEHRKDYTGGNNRYALLNNLQQTLGVLINEQ